MVDIPGDGTEWGINSDQFIREKILGNDAFYKIDIDVDPTDRKYHLVVHTYMYICIRTYHRVEYSTDI